MEEISTKWPALGKRKAGVAAGLSISSRNPGSVPSFVLPLIPTLIHAIHEPHALVSFRTGVTHLRDVIRDSGTLKCQ